MANTPKKSKRFEYNLRVVLKVRNIFEKIEKEKFAEAQREHIRQQQKEEEMKEYQKNMQKTLAKKLTGELTDFGSIMHRQEYLKKYKLDVVEQEGKTLEAEQKKEEQRERLIKAVKDRQILDKDKEHKNVKWKKIMNREETKFLDDISIARDFRKKRNML